MPLASAPIGAGALDRVADGIDCLVHGCRQIAAVFAYRRGYAADQLRAKPAGVAIGHVDQPLLGLAHHEPASERPRSDRPSEPDDHVEPVLGVLELEREGRGHMQPGGGQDIARPRPEHVFGGLLDLFENSLDAGRIVPLELGQLPADRGLEHGHEPVELGTNRSVDPRLELGGQLPGRPRPRARRRACEGPLAGGPPRAAHTA